MAINQVQLRLSIDGQQALSALDALEIKQQDLIASNKELSDSRTKEMDNLKNGLVEIYKLQEKQALLEKQMAAASEKGNPVLVTKLEGQYEANAQKLNTLFEAQVKYNDVIHDSDLALSANNAVIREQRKELEKLYVADGDVLRAEAALVKEKRALTRESSLAGNGSERQAKAEARLSEVNKELTNRIRDRAKATVTATQTIIKEQGIEKVSTDDLITLNKALETANRHRTDRTTEDAKEEIEAIKAVNKELANRKEETKPDDEGGFLSKFKDGLPSAIIGGAAGAVAGGIMSAIPAIAGAIGEAFGAAFDRIKTKALEITAIQTTLDVTRLKAKELNDSLSDINTKTSVAELNKLVEVAGDLNVPIADVKDFVRVADQIGTVLEKDFGSAEEAVTMISKLKDEFKATRDLKLDDALGNIGSMLKDLNLAGPATTAGIVDFLKRAGNIPDVLKPSITQMAAFAAVFEEANLSSEISASSFAKILTEGATNLDVFGKQMKLSKEEVKTLINENPNEFILKLSESLRGLKGDQLALTLKELHLEGSEAFKTVGVLIDNIDKVRQKQDLANKSFQEGTTILRIFTDVNADEAAELEKISKGWERIKTGVTSWIALLVGPAIKALSGLASKTEDVSAAYKRQKKETDSLIASVTPLQEQYEKLSDDAAKGAKNQKELNSVIAQIGKVMPSAIAESDKYGNALKVNIGLMKEGIKEAKKLAEVTKQTLKNDYSDKNNRLAGERKALVQTLNEKEVVTRIDGRTGDVTTKKLTNEDLRKVQKRLSEINKEIDDNWRSKKDLDRTETIKADSPATVRDAPLVKNGDDKADKKAKSAKDKALKLENAENKYLQEQSDRMIELEAKLAFEEKMTLASEEQKKVLQVENKAENELSQLHSLFKTKEGLIIEFANLSKAQQEFIHREEILIAKRLHEEKIKIQQEFQKKQDDVYEQHAAKVIQLAQDQKKLALDKNLQSAKNAGGSLGIYNAEERIINNDESNEKYNETVKFLKEQTEAKGNKEALELIEKNHFAALELIQAKYQQKRDQHIYEANEKERANAEKNKINSLGLDVKEAESKGKDPFQQKLALLKAQEDAEIASAEKTGANVLDIHRKFALERAALENEHNLKGIEKYINHFQQAFSAVSSIFSASLQNRTTEEQTSHENSIKKLDDQKEHGILTNRQYAKAKQLADKEHDKAQRKLKREQWELDKAATLTNIAMQTALAIMKAAPNIPLQVITGVLGGIEFGVAASQKAPAYATGGLIGNDRTKVTKPSKTAIQIWANEEGQEYISPNWQLNDPAVADLFGVLEYRRQNKITGYAKGGFIGDDAPVIKPSSKTLSNNNSEGDYLMLQFLKQNMEVLTIVADSVQNMQAKILWEEPDTYELAKKQTQMNKKLDSSYGNTNQSLIQ